MKDTHIIGGDALVLATHISHEGNDIHEKMEEEAVKNGYHIAYDGMLLCDLSVRNERG